MAESKEMVATGENDLSTIRGESVLLVLTEHGRVLCETREWAGVLIKSIPGGKVEPVDRESDAYTQVRTAYRLDNLIRPIFFRFCQVSVCDRRALI